MSARISIIGLVSVCLLAGLTMVSCKKYSARKSDIPFIKCEVCQHVAKALVLHVKEMRKNIAPKKLSELKIIELTEHICDADKDEGDWIQWLDIVESGSQLKIKEYGYPGNCQTECKTIEKTCQEVMGFLDTDVAELLYANPSMDRASLTNKLCHKLTSTCTTPPPPVPKDRKPGEAFTRKSDTEVERERMMRDMDAKSEKYYAENPGAPKMPKMKLYSRDDLMNKAAGGLGLSGEETEDDDDDDERTEEPAPVDNIDNFAKAFTEAEAKKDNKGPKKQSAFENLMNSIYANVNMLHQRGLEVSSYVKQWANKFVSSFRRKDDGEL